MASRLATHLFSAVAGGALMLPLLWWGTQPQERSDPLVAEAAAQDVADAGREECSGYHWPYVPPECLRPAAGPGEARLPHRVIDPAGGSTSPPQSPPRVRTPAADLPEYGRDEPAPATEPPASAPAGYTEVSSLPAREDDMAMVVVIRGGVRTEYRVPTH